MGGSGWDYREPYAGSVEATLIALQERILRTGEYLWPWDLEYRNPAFLAHQATSPARPGSGPARPATLAQLNEVKETMEFWDEGTHSILDMDQVIQADDDDQPGAIRPLTPAELTDVFGTPRPSGADLDRVYQVDGADPLGALCGERWTGRSVVIYAGSAPAEVFFWGTSGD